MSHTVTVVIPVYNVEKYLEQCLDSVINQTYKDIEIICINDGSTDNSITILEKYALSDNRIKIISQTNQGISAARNAGIKMATGKYITFLDSDDFLSRDAIEKMVTAIENNYVDFVVCQAHAFAETEADYVRLEKMEEWLQLFVKEQGIYNTRKKIPITCWAQLLKTEILHKNNILFPEEKLAYEDEYWRYVHISNCKTFYNLPEKIYHYRIRGNSITGAETKTAGPLDIIRINYLITKEMQKRNKWQLYQSELEQMFCSHIHTATIKSGRKYYSLAQEKIKELISVEGFSDKFYKRMQQYLSHPIPFSIIIPVYNTENYLKQCLDSIITQTIDLFEIICIDDGSTDNSLNILKEYAQKYENITVISQKNLGVSAARNKGLEVAQGRYILFVDSDDFIEPNLLEETYRKMQFDSLEWLLYGLRHYNDTTQEYNYQKYYSLPDRLGKYTIYEGTENFNTIINLPCECSNKIFLQENIQRNNMLFDTNLETGEDEFFNINYILNTQKFGILKEHLYNYRYPRKDSLCYQKQLSHSSCVSLNFIDKFGNLILKQSDMIIQRNLVAKYFRYLNKILSLPCENIEKLYSKLQLVLKNNKSILHLYKNTHPEICEKARYIIKHSFKQYTRKLKYDDFIQGKTINTLKNMLNFIKAYLLFPWYIYQIYTDNKNKAPH